MPYILLVCCIILGVLSSGCGSRSVLTVLQDPILVNIPITEKTQPVIFTKAVIKLRRGQFVGELQSGPLCLPDSDIVWRGGSRLFWTEEVQDVFRNEMQRANIDVVGDQEKLFGDPRKAAARFYVAALVRELRHNVCRPDDYFFDSVSMTSEASMKVEWQVYSLENKELVATISVRGTARIDVPRDTAEMDAIYEAFAQSVRFLIADSRFLNLVRRDGKYTPPVAHEHDSAISTDMTPLLLKGQSDSHATLVPLSEVQKRVVTVDTGAAFGSGFFVSKDGLILTNYHVVGPVKTVRIHLVSGIETTGAVLRINKKRDVALIQADFAKTPFLPIREDVPSVGDTVYAVGSPGGISREGSVTRGVISAFRLKNDLSFLQSDVAVTHGSSGGPLIDKDGAVVAMTVAGDTKAAGINFFIPIHDALRALHLVFDQSASSLVSDPNL